MFFFLFFLSFLKVCFNTILNKSKNILFHVNFPSLPCMCLWLTSGFNLYLLHRVITYQAAVFPLAYASSIVLDNSFRKHSAIIFQYIYFFLIWTWLFDRQTLTSVYTQRNPALRPPRFYEHLLSQLTSHSLSTQTWKSPSHFIILKTSLMGPPWYYDQDFMAQRWSHQRGSTVFFNVSFPHCRTKDKKNVRQLDYGN